MGSEPDDSVNHVWQTSQSIVLFLIGLIGIVPFIVSLYWIYRITLHRSRLSQHFWGSLDSSIGTNIRITDNRALLPCHNRANTPVSLSAPCCSASANIHTASTNIACDQVSGTTQAVAPVSLSTCSGSSPVRVR